MTKIEFWVTYDQVGHPREPGECFCPSRNVTIEISKDIYAMWAESMFASPLPVSVQRSDAVPNDPPRYIGEMPEVFVPRGARAVSFS